MQKIRLDITGIAYSQTQSGSYVLTLQEVGGLRKLPIVIGGFEAQAIAVELEKMVPSRPLTHDLFRAFSQAFSVQIKEILIYKFKEASFLPNSSASKTGSLPKSIRAPQMPSLLACASMPLSTHSAAF